MPRSAATVRSKRILAAGILILSGILLVCLASYFSIRHSGTDKAKPAPPQARASAAELVSATGVVLTRKPGRTEWQEVQTGARLIKGDLLRTDNSGDATIRYSDGTTVSIQAKTIYTVQTAGNSLMEISGAPLASGFENKAVESSNRSRGTQLVEEEGDELRPSIELHRIIPFGRSLELIGRVEAGSSLAVNGETVEVSGDGSFKHFTNPFPASAGRVHLAMKVTDLSGRARILTATHDFRPNNRGN